MLTTSRGGVGKMVRGKTSSGQNYYSEKLKTKLDELQYFPAAIVEAPSGYGKTTAVRDFFKRNLSGKNPVYWFTALDEPADTSFRRFSYLVSQIDEAAGARLLKIGLPNPATIAEACDALRSISCHQETYLVLDSLQFLGAALQPAFWCALVNHDAEKLHIILITQILELAPQAALAGCRYLHLTAADLRLTSEDIRQFYLLAGATLSPEEAERIEKHTEGWVIAVSLQLRAFQETGNFSSAAITGLMEHLVWHKLSTQQQLFLLHLCTFDAVTLQQASILTGHETLPPYALAALKSQFIRYEPQRQCYEVHTILHKLLKHKLRERGPAFEKQCYLRAGDLCQSEGRTLKALGFYWRAKDFERLLGLNFSPYIFTQVDGTPFSDIAVNLLKNCPPELKKKYPLAYLRLALVLLASGERAAFALLMKELDEMLTSAGHSGTPLYGEWLLLSAVSSYPDLDKMLATLNKAAPLFKGQYSQVIASDMPWWFLPMEDFYPRPGAADQQGLLFNEYITLLSQLTNGHGSGAAALYTAALAYHRGQIAEAETLAYKAAYLAGNKQQSITQLGAIFILAAVALYKADTQGWQHAIISMEQAASSPYQNTYPVRCAIDLTRGMLFAELQQLDEIADWLKQGDFAGQKLPKNMKPVALCIHGFYLLTQGEVPRLIGTLEASLEDDLIKNRPFNYQLIALTLAAGYYSINEGVKAAELVRSAARRTVPDGLIAPFVHCSWLLGGLVDKIIEREYPEHYRCFQETKERFSSGWDRLYQDLLAEGPPAGLSEREQEVALLAAEGLRNNEIAQKLFISESTVRTHLRTIFRKLDIDRRVKLAEKLKC